MSSSTQAPSPSTALDRRALIVLGVGVACVSTAAVLIRLADAPSLAIAAWRLMFAAALIWPATIARSRPELRSLSRHDVARMVIAGLFLALHFALWIASLDYTSVASSVVIVTTNPLWVALAAPFVLREAVPRRLFGGILLAFLGGALIAWGDFRLGGHALLGDLLALGGAWAAAAYFMIGRSVRSRVGLLPYVAIVYGTAAAVLLAAALATNAQMRGFSNETWAVLFLLALVPQILGHSSFNWALRRLSATFVAGSVLAEAIGSTILAWWILSEAPPPLTVVGGSLVLAGLVVAAREERRTSRLGP